MKCITTRRPWRPLAIAAVLALVGLASASCALFPNTRDSKDLLVYREKKTKPATYKKTDFGSPKDHVLAFGTANVNQIYMTQLDPRFPPVHADLGVAGTLSRGILGMERYNVFYAPPVAVGSKMQTTFYYFTVTVGRTTYLYSIDRPINLHDQMAYAAAKPGLLYLGDYAVKYTFGGGSDGLFKKGEKEELACLKKILGKFRKTEWEPVIKARIEELSK